MSIYKTFYVRGQQRYLKDNKLTSKIDIPESVLAILEGQPKGTQVEEDAHQLRTTAPAGEVTSVKTCVFCGERATRSRYVLAQTVSLCDEHYQNKTVGETAYIMKEKGYAPKEEAQNAEETESRVLDPKPRQQFDGAFNGLEDDVA